jgi:hypothetical protein
MSAALHRPCKLRPGHAPTSLGRSECPVVGLCVGKFQRGAGLHARTELPALKARVALDAPELWESKGDGRL